MKLDRRGICLLLFLPACCLHPTGDADGGAGGSCDPRLGCGIVCPLADGGVGNCCQGVCVDVYGPASCCGGCKSGETCIGGSCFAIDCSVDEVLDTPCWLDGGGLGVCCGGSCSDLSTDANCGDCGVPCPLGATCSNGACVAEGDPALCHGSTMCPPGADCVSDVADAGGACAWSDCAVAPAEEPCPLGPSQTGFCCAGSCVDVRYDSRHCGGCTAACSNGDVCWDTLCVSAVSCAQSKDGAICSQTGGSAGLCCGGSCVDPFTDRSNCGGCHLGCSAGADCVGAWCQVDGGPLLGCTGDSCASGFVCVSGFLGDSCLAASCSAADTFCAVDGGTIAGLCCGSRCIDPMNDPRNCGGCDDACVSRRCEAGACLPAAACGS